ncbi:MAG: hypothetical protein AAFR66_15835 [Bacteroidota bacterium]
MISPIYVRLILAFCLLCVFSCRSSSETISEKSASTKTNSQEYEKGTLVIQVKDEYKTALPDYDKDLPSLGTYPYLADLLDTYKVSSISSFIPKESGGAMGKFYKIHYDESISAREIMDALQQVEIIQLVEKVPINKTK